MSTKPFGAAPVFLSIAVSLFVAASHPPAQQLSATTTGHRVQLQFDISEAEAVLSILHKRANAETITESDWQRLFTSKPYIRLKKREAIMHRDFTDEDFQKFVFSPELATKARDLEQTLDAWQHADLDACAQRALAYLPQQAHIWAKVFPVIKPKSNSFVFESETDPTIFLYLDPEESTAKFENTVAHELHHIGFASVQPLADARQKNAPPNVKAAIQWMGAFGEGFAMLAAAGRPDIDPHLASSLKDRARWQHDMANFNQDLVSLQQFFLDIIDGGLTRKEDIEKQGYSFFGVQGPWYTVGYKMAIIVEKRYGRQKLIDCMLDPRELLVTYNQAAAEEIRGGKEKLALWSPELMQKLAMRQTLSK